MANTAAETYDVSNVAPGGATLNGWVFPDFGNSNHIGKGWFTYSTSQSTLENDDDGSEGTVTGQTDVPNTYGDLDISRAVTGLQNATEYFYRCWCSLLAGSNYTYGAGMVLSFSTPAAGGITFANLSSVPYYSSVNLAYAVNSNGSDVTVKIQYGTSTAYGSVKNVGTMNSIGNHAFSTTLINLTPGTTYFWRVWAELAATGADAYSAGQTFALTYDGPTIEAVPAYPVTTSAATMHAKIIHENCGDLTYYFDYGTSTGTYSSNTTGVTISGTEGFTNVSSGLTGLTNDIAYYYRLRIVNTSGTTYNGAELSFITQNQRFAVMNPSQHRLGWRFSGETDATRRYRERNKPVYNPKWKTSAIVNRTAYLGNVEIILEDGTTVLKPDRILKSLPGKPDMFTKSGFVDVAIEDGEDIVKLEALGDLLLQFKNDTLYVINVGGEYEYIEATFNHRGIAHDGASTLTAHGVAFANTNGCFLFSGKKVISLLEDRDGVHMISPDDWSGFITSTSQVSYIPKRDLLIVTDSCSKSESNGNFYIYDFRNAAWTYAKDKLSALDKTNFITDEDGSLIFSADNEEGRFYVVRCDGGKTEEPVILTKDYDFGDTSAQKKIYRVVVTYRGNTSTSYPRLQYAADGSGSFLAISGSFYNVGKDEWHVAVFTLPGIKCQTVQFKIWKTPAHVLLKNIDFEINDIIVEYRQIHQVLSESGSLSDNTSQGQEYAGGQTE